MVRKESNNESPTILVLLLCGLMFLTNMISSLVQVLLGRKSLNQFLVEARQIRILEMPDLIE